MDKEEFESMRSIVEAEMTKARLASLDAVLRQLSAAQTLVKAGASKDAVLQQLSALGASLEQMAAVEKQIAPGVR